MAMAEILEPARAAHGWSMKQVERQLWERLGDLTPTEETLRRYHSGKVTDETADLLTVLALADLYALTASDVSATVAKRLEKVRELVVRSRWDDTTWQVA